MDDPQDSRRRWIQSCETHFTRRVHERLGPRWDAKSLWDILRAEIPKNENEAMTFIVRMARNGRRLWRVETSIMTFFVIYDHELDCPVTVVVRGDVRPAGKPPINLEQYA